MAYALFSAVAERIKALIEEQALYHVNLVRGAEDEVHSLSGELQTIRKVLDDAEKRGVKETSVKQWLKKLEHLAYEMEDVLDEWDYAILKIKMEHEEQPNDVVTDPPKRKVSSFIQSSFKKVSVRYGIATKIQNVKAQLNKLSEEKNRYNFVMSEPTTDPSAESWRVQSTSLIDLDAVHGRDCDRKNLVTKLVSNVRSQEELGFHILSILGVGGIGKTTLAQLVYNDSQVEKSFDLRIWICVSDPFDVAVIARGIIESVKPRSSPNTNQLDVLFKHVIESISGKRFLLVLDDVWTLVYNQWESLKNCLKRGGAGSKILVTTRNRDAAKVVGTIEDDIYPLGQLSDEECWSLLRRIAFYGRTAGYRELEDIGRSIASKCKGLPLAAKALGSLLRSKSSLKEWKDILDSEIWKLKNAEVELFPHLLLSYNELSPTLKRCFSYCALFPKDNVFGVEDLIRHWMALGYLGSNIGSDMELEGRECFNSLANRSLFQDFEISYLDGQIYECKMHDIVHDFAQFLRKSDRAEAAGMSETSSSLVSTVNEFRSLFWDHKSPWNLYDVARLRVLSLAKCRLQSIPQGMENLIHLRWLNLDENTLSREDLKIVFELYNLQTLCLSGCDLQEIPREIRNLIHLRYLDLSWNGSLKELPREIGNLIHLRHLDLGQNGSLKELPREIGNLIHLRHLDLSWNGSLKELPREIGNLIHLRYLDLGWNGSLKELPREIGNLIHLRHLDLGNYMFSKKWPRESGSFTNNMSLKELPKEIGKLIQLRYLNLGSNRSLKELPKEIEKLIQLRYLNLGRIRSLKELPESICDLRELRTLDISIAAIFVDFLKGSTGS